MTEEASALRGMLESFRLRVDFYRFVQKPQVFDFFALPRNYAYTIILCHGGGGGTPEDMHVRFEVVDQVSGDYENPEDWDSATIELTPTNIAEHVQNRDGTLISIACGSGRAPLADAFLKSGYRSYIAPTETFSNTDSALVFVVNLFYHLMAEDRDYATTTYTEQEAVEKAAQLDPDFIYGTKLFRCYTSIENKV